MFGKNHCYEGRPCRPGVKRNKRIASPLYVFLSLPLITIIPAGKVVNLPAAADMTTTDVPDQPQLPLPTLPHFSAFQLPHFTVTGAQPGPNFPSYSFTLMCTHNAHFSKCGFKKRWHDFLSKDLST
ncbi:hypothetical protein Pelo_10840 [Pelomyxa schiedti]|nr:hypothetical protein Pelo_10840 [Pelomyxa schiedti]